MLKTTANNGIGRSFLYVLPKCDWFYFLAVKVEIKGKRCVVTSFLGGQFFLIFLCLEM